MKCLVVGGSGFIGSWVVDFLLNEGHEVIVLDNLSTGNKANLNEKVKLYEKDMCEDISFIFEQEKPEVVFHLAAQANVRKSISDPKEDARINVIGSLNVLENCIKHDVKKFIFSSSGGAIYGETNEMPTKEEVAPNPTSPYGLSKLTIEKYLEIFNKIYGLDFTILRYSNVYGPRQNGGEAGIISILINNLILNKHSTIYGDGEQTRDYVYVKDVAKANIKGLEIQGTYNVGTGNEVSLNELSNKIFDLAGERGELKKEPEIKGELKRNCLDPSKLISKGWINSYSLEEGLKETIDFFKKS